MAQNAVDIVIRAVDQASATLKRIEQTADRLANNPAWERATQASQRLAGGLGIAAAAAGTLGVGMIALAGRLEQSKIAFETMLGSAQEADRFLRTLADFAARTPFQFEGLQNSSRLLLAFGFEAERIIPIMRTLGDTTSALGGGTEELEGIARALGQIQTKGKVSTEELLQLAERGVPAFQILQEKLGLTGDQIGRIGELGIDAETAINALLEGLGERFAGSMERQSRTILGYLSTIRDEAFFTATAIGEKLTEALDLHERLERAAEALGRFRARVEELDLAAEFERLKPALTIAATTITAALIPAIVAAGTAAAAAAVALAPFLIGGAIIGGVIALGGAFLEARDKTSDYTSVADDLRDAVGTASDPQALAGRLFALSEHLAGDSKDAVLEWAEALAEGKTTIDQVAASVDALVDQMARPLEAQRALVQAEADALEQQLERIGSYTEADQYRLGGLIDQRDGIDRRLQTFVGRDLSEAERIEVQNLAERKAALDAEIAALQTAAQNAEAQAESVAILTERLDTLRGTIEDLTARIDAVRGTTPAADGSTPPANTGGGGGAGGSGGGAGAPGDAGTPRMPGPPAPRVPGGPLDALNTPYGPQTPTPVVVVPGGAIPGTLPGVGPERPNMGAAQPLLGEARGGPTGRGYIPAPTPLPGYPHGLPGIDPLAIYPGAHQVPISQQNRSSFDPLAWLGGTGGMTDDPSRAPIPMPEKDPLGAILGALDGGHGTTGMSDNTYVNPGGETGVGRDTTTFLEGLGNAANQVGEQLLNLAVDRIPLVGTIMSNLAGGPMAVLEAVFADLLGQTEAFSVVVDAVQIALEPIIAVLGRLLEALYPVINAALTLATAFLPIVEIIIGILEPALSVLGTIVGWLADAVIFVMNGIIRAYNALLGWLLGRIDTIERTDYTGEAERRREEREGNQAGGSSASGGNRIAEITGPTRDLLTDLLMPLAGLPSHLVALHQIRDLLDQRLVVTGDAPALATATTFSGDINITVEGSDDPRRTADEVYRLFSRRMRLEARGAAL